MDQNLFWLQEQQLWILLLCWRVPGPSVRKINIAINSASEKQNFQENRFQKIYSDQKYPLLADNNVSWKYWVSNHNLQQYWVSNYDEKPLIKIMASFPINSLVHCMIIYDTHFNDPGQNTELF